MQNIMEILQATYLCYPFDGKDVKQFEKGLNITLTLERIAHSKLTCMEHVKHSLNALQILST